MKLELEIQRAEFDKANAVAHSLGLNLKDAMRIMLSRFVAQKGLPSMQAPANDVGEPTTMAHPHGITLARLSELAASAGKKAAEKHAAAGRVSHLPDPAVTPDDRPIRQKLDFTR